MIKIENVDVFGWESAIRGMRNPLNSWDKSDSEFYYVYESYEELTQSYMKDDEIGENDLKLMKNLAKAGSDHSKYLRMINVTCDITAPLYWWKEYDTYKVGTVANSCSTMHKIHSKEFTMDDFSVDHLNSKSKRTMETVIIALNNNRELFVENNDKKFWWQMIQLLPSSYNQRRTVQLNYEVLRNMYFARRNHKLDEWREFCKWVESLPYFKEIFLE